MAVEYTKKSAYTLTGINEYYFDLMVKRPVPKLSSDTEITLSQTYHLRPDLLAFDLYEDSELWWVFAQRNPDVLKNPLIDFSVGTKIFIPTLETLRNTLGF
jgi:hypothetical protein